MIYKYTTVYKAKLYKFQNIDKAVLASEVESFMRSHNIIYTDQL